jgi:hypothetical protein
MILIGENMTTKQVNGQTQNEKRVKFVTDPAEKKDLLKGYVVRPWMGKILVDANYCFGEEKNTSDFASHENVKV